MYGKAASEAISEKTERLNAKRVFLIRDTNFPTVSQADLEGHLIMRRIVVTGVGLVSPLGCGSELAWSRLLSARSGLAPLPEWAAVLPARVAGIVPTKANDAEGGFDPDLLIPPKDQRRMDRFILFALVATAEAVAQAAWTPSDAHSLERTATIIASGIGGFPAIVEAVRTTDQRGQGSRPFGKGSQP